MDMLPFDSQASQVRGEINIRVYESDNSSVSCGLNGQFMPVEIASAAIALLRIVRKQEKGQEQPSDLVSQMLAREAQEWKQDHEFDSPSEAKAKPDEALQEELPDCDNCEMRELCENTDNPEECIKIKIKTEGFWNNLMNEYYSFEGTWDDFISGNIEIHQIPLREKSSEEKSKHLNLNQGTKGDKGSDQSIPQVLTILISWHNQLGS